MAQLQLPGGKKFKVGTAHLESLSNAAMRIQQMGIIFPLLESESDHSAFMGDFNCHTSWKENHSIPNNYKDIWASLKKEIGDTIDGFRFDRVLVRSHQYQPYQVEILGNDPIERINEKKEVYPSDHKGIYASVRKTN